jgi:hypothetical protein
VISVSSNIKTIGQKIQRAADSLATVISGGINEAASMEVKQTNENVNNMLDLRRIEFYELTGFTPSDPKKLECKIRVDERKAVPVAAFEMRQTIQGVEVYMYRFQPPALYEKAFGPNQRSLSRGVYYRITKRRFPIRKVKSIVLANEEPIKKEIEAGRKRIPESMILKMESNIGGLLK